MPQFCCTLKKQNQKQTTKPKKILPFSLTKYLNCILDARKIIGSNFYHIALISALYPLNTIGFRPMVLYPKYDALDITINYFSVAKRVIKAHFILTWWKTLNAHNYTIFSLWST